MEGGMQGEAFLSAASVNVLRSVAPPDEREAEGAMSRAAAPPPSDGEHAASATAAHLSPRYAHESLEERRARCMSRPADTLWCAHCNTTFNLAAVEHAVEAGASMGTGDAHKRLTQESGVGECSVLRSLVD